MRRPLQFNVSMHGTREELIKELKGITGILEISAETISLHIAPPGKPYRITCAVDGQLVEGNPKLGVKVVGKLEDETVQIVHRYRPEVDMEQLAALPLEKRTPDLWMERWVDENGKTCRVVEWCHLPMFAGPTPTPSDREP